MHLITVDELAALLKISRRSVYELTRRRSKTPIPVIRLGATLRFNRAAIEQWLQQLQESAQ